VAAPSSGYWGDWAGAENRATDSGVGGGAMGKRDGEEGMGGEEVREVKEVVRRGLRIPEGREGYTGDVYGREAVEGGHLEGVEDEMMENVQVGGKKGSWVCTF
jgi:hypothetical protein